ncbi:MAG: quinone-dependent dihydroorotate dehydrogenase [Bacteroidetes bacterium]|nr:quinone-dependent dihydroorotate dehydrogenase [Bacteroidota bacterium]MDA1337027.1 quinone-dependent dihydroorotate dehydrogenase [Bacteroidota bacterium]
MYRHFKSLIFKLEPEKAHEWTMRVWTIICGIPGVSHLLRRHFTVADARLAVEVAGLTFPNPVGLAAGFDKDARWLKEMQTLGFGFVEIGTVTPVPQAGNPQPRLFRLPQDRGIINRMGFNNEGMHAAAARLRSRPKGLLVGGNIGKNKMTPNEHADADYLKCFQILHPHVDYFVVNVSSPNTPGLRELQSKGPLKRILDLLMKENASLTASRPIFLKIAPDLTSEQLDEIVLLVQETGIAGVIATNTTISRQGLTAEEDLIASMGAGGLSGVPIRDRSTEVIRHLHQKSKGTFPIIGVGGILNGSDAQEKLEAGASLVQVYSGLIYEGPTMVKRINEKLLDAMQDSTEV